MNQKQNNQDALKAARMTLEVGTQDLPRFVGALERLTGQKEWWCAGESHPVPVAVGMHVGHVLSLLKSVLILFSSERAQFQAIGVLSRSLYECANKGVWIAHPESDSAKERRARSFFRYREKTRKAFAALAPKHGIPHASSPDDLKKDGDIRKEINEEFKKDSYCIGYYSVLEELGKAEWYEPHYGFLSCVTHGLEFMPPDMAGSYVLAAASYFLRVREQAANVLSESEFAAIFGPANEAVNEVFMRRIKEAEAMGF